VQNYVKVSYCSEWLAGKPCMSVWNPSELDSRNLQFGGFYVLLGAMFSGLTCQVQSLACVACCYFWYYLKYFYVRGIIYAIFCN